MYSLNVSLTARSSLDGGNGILGGEVILIYLGDGSCRRELHLIFSTLRYEGMGSKED